MSLISQNNPNLSFVANNIKDTYPRTRNSLKEKRKLFSSTPCSSVEYNNEQKLLYYIEKCLPMFLQMYDIRKNPTKSKLAAYLDSDDSYLEAFIREAKSYYALSPFPNCVLKNYETTKTTFLEDIGLTPCKRTKKSDVLKKEDVKTLHNTTQVSTNEVKSEIKVKKQSETKKRRHSENSNILKDAKLFDYVQQNKCVSNKSFDRKMKYSTKKPTRHSGRISNPITRDIAYIYVIKCDENETVSSDVKTPLNTEIKHETKPEAKSAKRRLFCEDEWMTFFNSQSHIDLL